MIIILHYFLMYIPYSSSDTKIQKRMIHVKLVQDEISIPTATKIYSDLVESKHGFMTQ